MGVSGGAMRYHCTYGCDSGGAACSSKESYDAWISKELHDAIIEQDATKIHDILDFAPKLKEHELMLPDDATPKTALAMALNRRDAKVVRALLDAGVSPNLPVSEQQRAVYAHRSQLAALNGGDPDLQNLVPSTHFEALCSTQHKELFMLLLDKSANPNSGIIQVCHCGDLEMLEAILVRCGEPNGWLRQSTPLASAAKSRIQPYDKVVSLLRASADPNFVGAPASRGAKAPYPPLTIAARKRDYRLVKALLDAGADVNLAAADEGLPNPLFWATYWGELELLKLLMTHSKHRLDFTVRKHTNETIFDVAEASRNFAQMQKPKHIAKLPLPNRPVVVYDKICQMLEEYRLRFPDAAAGGSSCSASRLTASTAATTGGRDLSSSPA